MKSITLKLPIILLAWLITGTVFPQGVVVSDDANATPHGSAMLDVQTAEKGMLVPRMTKAQRDAISNPANGLLIYQTDNDPGFYYNAGTPESPQWQNLAGSDGIWQVSGGSVYRINGNIGIGEMEPAGKLHVSSPGEWDGITFTGTGLNDLTVDISGYTGTGSTDYAIRIQNPGPDPNLIEISSDGGGTWTAPLPITTDIDMGFGVTANFGNTFGYTYDDRWDWTVNEGFSDVLIVQGRNIGIGTTEPTAFLHVEGMGAGEGNVLFTGEIKFSGQFGNPPAEGPGTRLMWYPDKAALRAGHVTGMAWDSDSLGYYSNAWGVNTRASGTTSTAWGHNNRAIGTNATAWGGSNIASSSNSTAWGSKTIASGMRSTAWGDSTVASGFYSTAWGYNAMSSSYGTTAWGENTSATTYYATAWGSNTIASGRYATAWGRNTIASGRYATSWGTDTEAEGWYATTWGNNTLASARYSTAWGNSATALSGYETVIGAYNTLYEPVSTFGWNTNDRLFVIANGTHNLTRSDALVVMKNGNVGIGISNPTTRFEVNGQIKILGGSPGAGRVLASDDEGLASWASTSSFSSGTLDEAYNFGGNGSGRTIQADAGALKITGTDGFLITGAVSTGEEIEVSGPGTRMFFNPRRAAFRAGHVNNAGWDADSLGLYSIAMGRSARATAESSVALGQAIASGVNSTAIGLVTTASGNASTAIGSRTTAQSGFEIAMGRWNTLYTPLSTLGWNENDRLFVLGNGTGNWSRSDALVILKNGFTGLGNSNPEAPLHITDGTADIRLGTGFASIKTRLSFNDTSNEDSYIEKLDEGKLRFRVGGTTTRMTITADGYVGINTQSPDPFFLAVNGDAAKPGGGSWSAFSDSRLKNSIEPIKPGMLDHLLQLNGYTFEYEPEAIEKRLALPGRQTGLIAQEVQQVFPDWVESDDDGYLYVTERGLTAIIVEALRELREEKDAEIANLKAEKEAAVANLTARLQSLEILLYDDKQQQERMFSQAD